MNRKILLWMASLVCLFLASCNDDDDDKQTFEVVSLSGLDSESGPGNVLLKWDKIESDGVAYVEIAYGLDTDVNKKALVNPKETEKLIYGFATEDTCAFILRVCMEDGSKSEAQTIETAPKKPYFFDLQDAIEISSDFGGVNLSWNNASNEKFYINAEYTNAVGVVNSTEIDIVENDKGTRFIPVVGTLKANLQITVTDIVGNVSAPSAYEYTQLEKGKFDRSIWQILVRPTQWGAANSPEKMLDGNPATAWHTAKPMNKLNHIAFDLKRKVKIEEIEAQHRPNSTNVDKLILYGANNYVGAQEFIEEEWTSIDTMVMTRGNSIITRKEIKAPVEYRYIWVKVLSIGNNYGVLAEFALHGEDIVE